MPTTLVVLAHPERQSFNGAWADETARASEALGHDALWSDLCGAGFDPVEDAGHYERTPAPFDPLKAQENAAGRSALPADVAGEIDKITHADRLIFHFPLWWFGPPAILKGWCDRVLAHGALHSVDQRFDDGTCRGKKALFCVTTGATAVETAHNGREGDVQMLLWPLAYTLRYLGMTVLAPQVISGVHGYFEGDANTALKVRLADRLGDHQKTIVNFDRIPTITFNADNDFDPDGRLSADAPGYSHFIRHDP